MRLGVPSEDLLSLKQSESPRQLCRAAGGPASRILTWDGELFQLGGSQAVFFANPLHFVGCEGLRQTMSRFRRGIDMGWFESILNSIKSNSFPPNALLRDAFLVR